MADLGFAKAIHEFNDNMPSGMSDCEHYGMTYGCDEDCPQMMRGECPIPKENKDIIERAGKTEKYSEL